MDSGAQSEKYFYWPIQSKDEPNPFKTDAKSTREYTKVSEKKIESDDYLS